jgi:hypothetical protein
MFKRFYLLLQMKLFFLSTVNALIVNGKGINIVVKKLMSID